MIYRENFDASQKRLEALWRGELIDRCSLAVLVHNEIAQEELAKRPNPKDPADCRSFYMDAERVLKRNLKIFENTAFLGEAFPAVFPFFGTSGHLKYFRGARYNFGRDSIWYDPSITDLSRELPEYDPCGSIFQEEKRFLQYLADEAKGRYMVSMPDNCGILDGLAALHGNEELLIDMLESGDDVLHAVSALIEGFTASAAELFDIAAPTCMGGSSQGWMYTYSPGRHLQMQADVSVMISKPAYDRFVLPELEAITGFLDHAIYHLDGVEQTRHLETLLSLERLHLIQWTPVAGQPKTSAFLEHLKRIQAAGKGLILLPQKDEVETLMTELSSKGLHIVLNDVDSVEEGEYFIRLAEKLSHE